MNTDCPADYFGDREQDTANVGVSELAEVDGTVDASIFAVFIPTHLPRGCFAGGMIRILTAGTLSEHRHAALRSAATAPDAREEVFQLDAVTLDIVRIARLAVPSLR